MKVLLSTLGQWKWHCRSSAFQIKCENTTKALSLNGVSFFYGQEKRKRDKMTEHSDIYRKLAQDIKAMFEKEQGKFDYSDFSLAFSIINRENFSASTNANGWSYNNLTPERKADYDFMMHM